MYAILGTVIFEGLIGFDSFSNERSVNYAEHALVEGYPLAQAVGYNLAKVNFSMRLHSSFCNPEAQLAVLEAAMNARTVLPLITGSGRNLGDFRINAIRETPSQTDRSGNNVVVTLDVDLSQYVEKDKDAAAKLKARQNGLGMSSNNPLALSTPPSPLGAAAGIMSSLTKAKAAHGQFKEAVAESTSNEGRAQRAFDKATRAIKKTQAALQEVKNKALAAEQVVAQARAIKAQTEQAIRNAETAASYLAVFPPDAGDVAAAANSLNNSMSNLSSAATPLGAVAGKRSR